MWYGKFLGNGAAALKPTLEIQQKFLLAFAAAGQPDDMAIFSKSGITDAGDSEVTLYFSPAAASFAKTIQGVAPSEKPTLENLGLLVGNSPAAFRALFSEWRPRSER